MGHETCQILYVKYNAVRAPRYRITTELCKNEKGKFVRKRAGEDKARAHLEKIYQNGIALRDYYRDIKVVPSEWHEGTLKFSYLEGCTLADQIDMQHIDKDQFVAQVNKKLAAVLSVRDRYIVPFEMTGGFEAVFGKVDIKDAVAFNPANVDSLFTNFIENNTGVYCIDYEWVFNFPVPVAFIKYRILLYLYVNLAHIFLNDVSLEEMLGWFGFTEHECATYWEMDNRFQQLVHGKNRQYIYPERYKKENRSIQELIGSIQDKNMHIRNMEDSIKDLQQQIYDKNTQIRNMEDSIKDLQQQIYDKNTQIHNMEDSIKDLQQQIYDKNTQIRNMEDSIKDLQQQIYDKNTQIRNLEDSIKDLQQQIYDKNTQIRNMEDSIKDLQQQIYDKNAQIQNMEDSIKDLQQQIYDKNAHIHNMEDTVRNLQQQISDKNGQITGLESNIESMQQQLFEKETYIQNLNGQIQKLSLDYQTISNAFFWKITKPARLALDGIKNIIKTNEVVYRTLWNLKTIVHFGPKKAKAMIRQHDAGLRKKMPGIAWLSDEEREAQRQTVFNKSIKISVLVPLYNTPLNFLQEMIESVQNQTYEKWELCLADGSDAAHAEVEKVCVNYARKDKRIKYRKLKENLGISGNTNACIKMAKGDYIALFDHDDILHPSAFYEVMKAICDKGADYIYTDETTFESPDINHLITTHYKPDFAPDNLLANNYICHLSVFSADLLKQVKGFRSQYDGSQDHDIILRLTNAAKRIVHIPKVLYWWRSHPMSVAQDIGAKQYAVDAAKRAVQDFLWDYKHVRVNALSTRAFPTIFQIVYPIENLSKISIVIPNCDHIKDLQRCITSILEKTLYTNYEIVIAENNSKKEETFNYYATLKDNPKIRVLHYDDQFNYSKINNWAIRQTTGEYIVLLNNDTQIITPNWLECMLMYAQRDDVGAVGAKLYFPDGRIQHAGIILKLGADRIAGHAFYGVDHDNLGYMGRLCYAQDVSAVTAACLMVKRTKYDEVQGMDESFAVAFNDVDFCLKLREKGYLNIFTPFAELYHYESASRGSETDEKLVRFKTECEMFRNRWGTVLDAGDPYYNPNFSLDTSTFDSI